jgi:hypothetical protein
MNSTFYAATQLLELPELEPVETLLVSAGYPPLRGELDVNLVKCWNLDVWSLENTPRFVWSWRKLRLVLDQMYLVRNRSGEVVNIHHIANGDPRIV